MEYAEPVRWKYYPTNARPPAPLRDFVAAVESLQEWLKEEWWGKIHPANPRTSTPEITKAVAAILPATHDATPQEPYGLLPGWNFETREKYRKMSFLYGEGHESLGAVNPDGVHVDGNRLTLIEIEGGGAFTNYRGMKDIVEGLLLPSVDYLALMVPHAAHNTVPYRYYKRLVEAMYGEQVIQAHLKGVLVLGY